MQPAPPSLQQLALQAPERVFCAARLHGLGAPSEIFTALHHLTRLGCPITTGSSCPRTAWGKILLCYRDYGGTQNTAITGVRSWYDDMKGNLRLDVDQALPGQGDSLWGTFIVAIANVPDETPRSCQPDPTGEEFAKWYHSLQHMC